MPSPRFTLSFQTALPDDYQKDAAFRSLLDALRDLGFWGVELNVGDPRDCRAETIGSFLAGFGLEVSMLATGLTAKRLGLSLSHPEEDARRRSVDKCREMIEWAAAVRAGLIIGFLKGGVSPDPAGSRARLRKSLEQIVPFASERSTPILVEATNRYESSVANTLEETVALLEGLDVAHARVLPDTFHMNIEEADMFGSLSRYRARFISLHLSDNNRRFPGFGSIDFRRVIHHLRDIGYEGRLAIEGNPGGDVVEDLRQSMKCLGPLLARLRAPSGFVES
ncbi:MAG: sugar phosphate isomerase/epimerase family protein [Spirochaetia bacterium]|jgi:sugar phosphate isomerase/epimerase